jgi:hypothetical protein
MKLLIPNTCSLDLFKIVVSEADCVEKFSFPTTYGYYFGKLALAVCAFFILLMSNLLIAQFK